MRKFLYWFCFATAVFAMSACGGGGGGGSSSDNSGEFPTPSGPPADIVLTSQYIASEGNFTIFASVTDAFGNPANDGTVVAFSASGGDVSPSQVSTVGGQASTILIPTSPGSASVSAVINANVTDELLLTLAGPPATIVLSSDLTPGVSLSPGESTTVTAFITDSAGRPVYDGTLVYFSADSNATVDATAPTRNGFATAQFRAGPFSGTVSVRADTAVDPETGNNASQTLTVPVSDGNVAVISFLEVTPDDFIAVRGSGQNEMAQLRFRIQDAAGNPVPNGTRIDFTLSPRMSGGARLVEETTSVVNGEVVARVQSGSVAGPLRVVASYTSPLGVTVSSQGLVAVVGGMPVNERLTMSQTYFNQAGYRTEGLLNFFNVSLADRFGNIVKDGTPVSFISDCGRIGVNAIGVDELGSFIVTTTDGKASAEFRTGNPIKPLCNIVGYTTGQEAYADLNGNGIYENGSDICTGDRGEPFLDENNNGQHDSGELYIDTNGNGRYDGPNGICDMETIIWGNSKVTMSATVGPLNLQYYNTDTSSWVSAPSSGLALSHGESLSLRFFAQDEFGSALVSDTTVSINADRLECRESIALFNSDIPPAGPGILYLLRTKLPDRSGGGDSFQVLLQDTTTHDAEETPKVCRIDFSIDPPEGVGDDPTTAGSGSNGSPRSATIFVSTGGDF
ncbi:MAG: hypothetical protein RQ723_10820 [Desulfuromonadales bacterium]|nr:hypothetical protein [Desulfuromonadales bacterium]